MRKAARRDSNEAALVELFKAHGCEVERINLKGWPDLLVGWGNVCGSALWMDYAAAKPKQILQPFSNRTALVEVKTRTGTVRAAQVKFHARFPVWIVRTDREAEAVIRWLKEKSA